MHLLNCTQYFWTNDADSSYLMTVEVTRTTPAIDYYAIPEDRSMFTHVDIHLFVTAAWILSKDHIDPYRNVITTTTFP
jgi:hypothetical protein